MTFSAAHGLYEDWRVDAIRREQAVIANAISQFEPVVMLVNSGDETIAREYCGPRIKTLELEHFDIWARDTLPAFVHVDDYSIHTVNWNFNVWGEKYPEFYDADRTLAERFALQTGRYQQRAPIIMEGGAIDTNGNTILTTETCLLNDNRNSGFTREIIDRVFADLLGVNNVIWLHGSEADTVTDGHVDSLARFFRPNVVVAEVTDDPADPEYRDLLENVHRLEGATDARGNPIEIIRLLRPDWTRMPARGDNYAASYLNCYIANGGVVMPRFGDQERDEAARALFQLLLPNREIVQIHFDEICEGGGGIHCSTQHLPEGIL